MLFYETTSCSRLRSEVVCSSSSELEATLPLSPTLLLPLRRTSHASAARAGLIQVETAAKLYLGSNKVWDSSVLPL